MCTVNTKCFQYGQEDIDYLKSVDETLGAAMMRIGRLERVINPDLFAALVHTIVGQLISVKAAHTIWERLQHQCGEISPQNIAMQTVENIKKCGLTLKKAVCIQHIAATVAQGDFLLEELYDLSDAEVVLKLITFNGVGQWTAEMLLMHALGRGDVVSWGDIAIRRGMMKLYGLSTLSKEQFEQYRLRYSPLGSVASIYLWEISSQ